MYILIYNKVGLIALKNIKLFKTGIKKHLCDKHRCESWINFHRYKDCLVQLKLLLPIQQLFWRPRDYERHHIRQY